MSLVNNKRVKDWVVLLLTNYPELRDNDRRLAANIWGKQFNLNRSARDFCRAYANGDVAHFESIRRIRQKLQEEHPELRGKRYEERQGTREETERQSINAWRQQSL